MKTKKEMKAKKIKAYAILRQIDSLKGKQWVLYPYSLGFEIYSMKKDAIPETKRFEGKSKVVECIIKYEV